MLKSWWETTPMHPCRTPTTVFPFYFSWFIASCDHILCHFGNHRVNLKLSTSSTSSPCIQKKVLSSSLWSSSIQPWFWSFWYSASDPSLRLLFSLPLVVPSVLSCCYRQEWYHQNGYPLTTYYDTSMEVVQGISHYLFRIDVKKLRG